jgi:hypothetical protein
VAGAFGVFGHNSTGFYRYQSIVMPRRFSGHVSPIWSTFRSGSVVMAACAVFKDDFQGMPIPIWEIWRKAVEKMRQWIPERQSPKSK